MAHFAQIETAGDGSKYVADLIVVKNCAIGGCVGSSSDGYVASDHAECGSLEFPDTEPLGQAMLAESGFTGEWLQCSYSGSFRGTYPAMGWSWDGTNFSQPVPNA